MILETLDLVQHPQLDRQELLIRVLHVNCVDVRLLQKWTAFNCSSSNMRRHLPSTC
jgi:hypothetical protein